MELLVLVRGSEMTTSRSLPAGERSTLVGGPTAASKRETRYEIQEWID